MMTMTEMTSSTLIEVLGNVVFSFTRGVIEHFNPEEPEFTAESFGYDPLQSTGREWNYIPVDEFIYQEYSDREFADFHYMPSSRINVRAIDACTGEENEERHVQEDQQDEDRAMAWKRLRPSTLRTICKSMYIGASISLLAASIVGTMYSVISYLCYKVILNCRLQPKLSIPIRVQWTITVADLISCAFYHFHLFFTLLFLFRPHQLKGLKQKLILVCCVGYTLDALYRVSLQIMIKPYYLLSFLYQVPFYIFILFSVCLQLYLLARHFFISSGRQIAGFTCKMAVPYCFSFIVAFAIANFIYPAYNKQNKEDKLLIAIFAPLIGVFLKVISRICVQRLWNISYPGYSSVLLAPVYFGSAVIFRVLQADLGSLKSIAILGIIHGAAEVVERSTMVAIDHISHMIWKRTSASWGSFRTARRERLMADIAIMSMLYESTAIVSVNCFLYLYQLIYLQNDSLLKLLQSLAITTSVQLVIEWFFTSVSLAIETHYQNMAVMAVWRRRWKRHILVAIMNAVPIAIWTTCSNAFLIIVRGRFNVTVAGQSCNMPFT